MYIPDSVKCYDLIIEDICPLLLATEQYDLTSHYKRGKQSLMLVALVSTLGYIQTSSNTPPIKKLIIIFQIFY
jgi:hypothetical protein